MNKRIIYIILMGVLLLSCCCQKNPSGLKDAFTGKFLTGVALNDYQIHGKDSVSLPLTLQHFNSVVAENCMKSEVIQPQQGKFNFEQADRFVDFGVQNQMFVVGHCLIWHSQAPNWFFIDSAGNNVSRDTLIERMNQHISTLVSRYKGRVGGWDVVNEALTDEGEWRKSKFYEIIGKEYVELAFRFAHEADPNAELYYNEYNVEKPAKRQATVKLVRSLMDKGIKISGVGIQGHCTMTFPEYADMDSSIAAIGALGVPVMITEMDISVLPWPADDVSAEVSLQLKQDPKWNPYPDGLPDSVEIALENRWAAFWGLFLKHKNVISRVTIWGLHDLQSWRNNWPIYGRSDYPLLFDRNYQPKPTVDRLIKMGLEDK